MTNFKYNGIIISFETKFTERQGIVLDISSIYKYLVPITQFNKGKASRLYSRAQKGEKLIVIKNNSPVAVILSPEEYELLNSFPKLCIEATENKQEIDKVRMEALFKKFKALEKKGE